MSKFDLFCQYEKATVELKFRWKCYTFQQFKLQTMSSMGREGVIESQCIKSYALLKLYISYFDNFESKCLGWFQVFFIVSMKLWCSIQSAHLRSVLRQQHLNKKKKWNEINSNTMHVFELRIFFQLQLWCWLNSSSLFVSSEKQAQLLRMQYKCSKYSCASFFFSILFVLFFLTLSLSFFFTFSLPLALRLYVYIFTTTHWVK